MRPHGTKFELEARRMHAIKLLQQGMPAARVADRVGVTEGAVSQWKKAYQCAGKEGLKAKPHPGRKPRLSPVQRHQLAEMLLQGPRAHGFSTDLWTLARVTEVIKRHFGITYHISTTWHILTSMGWSCQRPERHAREQDEQAVAKWRQHDWPRIKKIPA